MAWLQTIATLLSATAAAFSIGESVGKAQRGAARRRQLKRGGYISPRDAARELEHQIGGRVAVGQDDKGYKLVVMRTKPGVKALPADFSGYRVEPQQKIRIAGWE